MLPETGLRDLPFQLLPRAVYPVAKMEPGLKWQEAYVKSLVHPPRFTAVVRFFSGDSLEDLDRLMQSLAVQSCQGVTLRVVDFSGRVAEVSELFQAHQVPGECFSAEAGAEIFANITSEYVLPLTVGTLLHPQALFIFLKEILKTHPTLIYTNEVTLAEDGVTPVRFLRKAPVDRYSLLSYNFIGDPILVLREYLAECLPRAQEAKLLESQTFAGLSWFLAARAVAENRGVHFIPLGLFYRPAKESADIESSVAAAISRSLAEALALPVHEIKGAVSPYGAAAKVRLQGGSGKIQVIIPFKDRAHLTLTCLKSLLTQDLFSDLEITLVDNNSSAEERRKVDEFIRREGLEKKAQVIDDREYFNYARLNNRAAKESDTPYILFLNNDVELMHAGCISELRSWCALADVGAVGGALFYEDGTLQSGGINFLGVRPCNVNSEDFFSGLLRETNGVSFALALVKRAAFSAIDGLDEVVCPNGFGDAIFCKRLVESGYRVLSSPQALATHRESVSRGYMPEEYELFELHGAGVPISDLYAEFAAKNQPMSVDIGPVPQAPLSAVYHRVTRSRVLYPVANRLAEVVLKGASLTRRFSGSAKQ